jgi:peptide/nickel transport system permease protein
VTAQAEQRRSAARSWPRLPLRAHPTLRLGLLVLLGMITVAAWGTVALPGAGQQDLAQSFLPPLSPGHLLGTDQLGQDVLAWTSAGIWVGLEVSLAVVSISAVIGISVGLCAGYYGGIIDVVVMRLVDVCLSIPPLLVFVAAAALLRPSMLTLILLISAVAWLPYARLVRSVVLVERERGYVLAARLTGASRARVLFGHLLPAVSTPALVLGSLQAGYVLLWEAGLSFLGLGIRPPQHSLGYLIAEGRETLSTAWWVVVFPGAALALLVLAAHLIGDGLRDLVQQDVEIIGR